MWDVNAKEQVNNINAEHKYSWNTELNMVTVWKITASSNLPVSKVTPFRSTWVTPVFSGIRATWSLVYVCKSLFVLLPFFFWPCVVCSSTYRSWLPLWYLQNPFRIFAMMEQRMVLYHLNIVKLMTKYFQPRLLPNLYVNYLFCVILS